LFNKRIAELVLVIVVYFRNDEFNSVQRWSICGIIGGGIGNIIDRFFRAEGVVDFIDVKFFGIFGLDRWPTFNVADAAVVVCGIILIVSFLITICKEKKDSANE
jgi:signal peptidase II